MKTEQDRIPRSAHVDFLQELCLSLLRENWQNDRQCASVAAALLAVVAHKALFHRRGKAYEQRALRALRLLREIEEFQIATEKQETGERPVYADRYPHTKAVLWEALLLGALMSESQKRQIFLARALLGVRDFGLPGDEGEYNVLKKTLRDVLDDYQPHSEKIGTILKECTQESNPAVVRVLGHAYVNHASPVEVARMCKA